HVLDSWNFSGHVLDAIQRLLAIGIGYGVFPFVDHDVDGRFGLTAIALRCGVADMPTAKHCAAGKHDHKRRHVNYGKTPLVHRFSPEEPVGPEAYPRRAETRDDVRALAREIFKQLSEINTTDSAGNVTTAAEAMAKRLRDAGFPEKDVIVAGPNERKKNLVARIPGAGKQKPILLLAHLDVVKARRDDWSTDPFHFVERERY